jgi:hypothetical protein
VPPTWVNLNYGKEMIYRFIISFLFSCTDGCFVIAASRPPVFYLWHRISHVEDPKALKGKMDVSQYKNEHRFCSLKKIPD